MYINISFARLSKKKERHANTTHINYLFGDVPKLRQDMPSLEINFGWEWYENFPSRMLWLTVHKRKQSLELIFNSIVWTKTYWINLSRIKLKFLRTELWIFNLDFLILYCSSISSNSLMQLCLKLHNLWQCFCMVL